MNEHDQISDLEEKFAEVLAQEMQQEIDREIVDTIIMESIIKNGWTPTKINPAFGDIVSSIDWYSITAEWIHKNAVGDYKLVKGQWLFELESDAVMFILRWS